MAPKREISSSNRKRNGTPRKKVKTKNTVTDPLEKKVEAIKDAIVQYEEDPAMRTLLTEAAKHAFEHPVDKRPKICTAYIEVIRFAIAKYVLKFENKARETAILCRLQETSTLHLSQLKELHDETLSEVSQIMADVSTHEGKLLEARADLRVKKDIKADACGYIAVLENHARQADIDLRRFKKLADSFSSCGKKGPTKLATKMMPYLRLHMPTISLNEACTMLHGKESRQGLIGIVLAKIGKDLNKFNNSVEIESEKHKDVIGVVLEAESAFKLADDTCKRSQKALQARARESKRISEELKKVSKEVNARDELSKNDLTRQCQHDCEIGLQGINGHLHAVSCFPP